MPANVAVTPERRITMPEGAIVTNHADTGTHREDHVPVDLNQPLALIVHTFNGDVTVRATDRNDVLVGQVMHGRPEDLDDGLATIDARGNRIEIHANPHGGAGWSGEIDLDAVVGQITKAFRWGGPWPPARGGKARVAIGGNAWCDIVVEMPRAMTGRIDINTTSGDIRIDGVSCETSLQTASGDVRVASVRGDLALHSASGDLALERVQGRLSVNSASGDLRVISSRIDGFDIQSASGNINLDAILTGDSRCSAQTASGDVRLTLRGSSPSGQGGQEPSATITFHSMSGDAHVAPPFRKTERRTWQAGAGNEGPHIEITTMSGDLAATIAAVDDAASPAASPVSHPGHVGNGVPAPPAPPESHAPNSERIEIVSATFIAPEQELKPARDDTARLAVLEAVERGEIDVEEALRQLEAADAAPNP